MRSILFGLACAWAAAINFSECYEPLIRLANGACNLAEAKTHSTLNCRYTVTETATALIEFCVCESQIVTVHMHVFICIEVTVCL